jgi:hypothetical protein
MNGRGSVWTRLHKPITLLEVQQSTSRFEEDKIVKEYMNLHGVENVRGGSYSQQELSDTQKTLLLTEIRSANDLCLRCGRGTHFVKSCYAKTDTDGKELDCSKFLQKIGKDVDSRTPFNSESTYDKDDEDIQIGKRSFFSRLCCM